MKSRINAWKFSLAFLAASISANSTVVWAASEIQNQKAMNKFIREQVVMDGLTMNQAYQKHAGMLSPSSQVAMEEWLKSHGNEAYPAPQVQKFGKDNSLTKFISTFGGKAYTFTIDEKNPDQININGQKFTLLEAQDLGFVLRKLASNDSTLKPVADQIDQIKDPKPKGHGDLTGDEFIRLPNPKKMEYLMLMRELVEAAGNVHYEASKTISAAEMEAATYAYHPLMNVAMAASGLLGKACLVAGNISVYEQSGKRIKCNPNPTTVTGNYYDRMKSFNSQCPAGLDTACNPLVYGFNTDGKPHCLSSTDQPDFTNKATANCNRASQLTEVLYGSSAEELAKQQLQRKKDMVRILESYYNNQNPGKEPAIKNCFAEDRSAIKENCKDFFIEQRDAFMEFHKEALELCEGLKMKDQKAACDALRRRALDLALFTETVRPVPPIVPIDKEKLCEGIGKWNKDTKQCLCPNGKPADNEAGTYTCAYPTKECPANRQWSEESQQCELILGGVEVVGKPEKDRCEKEDGSKKWYCSKGLWIGVGIAALLFFLWPRGKKPKTPPREGGTGTNPGNSGGVRTTTTTLRGTQ